MSYEIDREDIVLLLLDANRRLSGQDAFKGITRLEKLIFLLAMEKGLSPANRLFGFKAYKFGPFSKDVYEATEFLSGLDFLKVDERPLVSYYATTEEELLADETSQDDESVVVDAHEKIFTLTESGKTVATKLRELWQKEHPDDLKKIEDIVRGYAALPLNQIIRYVYRRYPAMAAKSVHPEAQFLPNA